VRYFSLERDWNFLDQSRRIWYINTWWSSGPIQRYFQFTSRNTLPVAGRFFCLTGNTKAAQRRPVETSGSHPKLDRNTEAVVGLFMASPPPTNTVNKGSYRFFPQISPDKR
jgi:hypothetical protein